MYKLLILLILFSCHSSSQDEFRAEVLSLDTPQKQSEYLEAIYDLDQQVRKKSTAAETQFGYNSKEHKAAIQIWMDTDRANQQKIELFLEQYGHPKLKFHTEKAVGTPWLVIHHSPDGYDIRLKHFHHFYKAYVNGDLDGDTLTFFMNRMYATKFGDRIEWDGPFTTEMELDTLLKTMNLYSIVESIEAPIE